MPAGLYGHDQSGDVTTDATTGNSYLYDADGNVCAVKNEALLGTCAMTGYLYNTDGARIGDEPVDHAAGVSGVPHIVAFPMVLRL
jgi:hypothetical protein